MTKKKKEEEPYLKEKFYISGFTLCSTQGDKITVEIDNDIVTIVDSNDNNTMEFPITLFEKMMEIYKEKLGKDTI